MEMEIDHYVVLGLSSGEEGRKLTDVEIGKAYRRKALELHPDKRRNDPNANSKFLRLKSSYEVLKDEKTRKQFDDLLRVKRQRECQDNNSRKRKMMSDLEEREHASFARDFMEKDQDEEEARFAKKLKEEMVRIRRDSCRNTGNFFRVWKNARNGRFEFRKLYVFESE
ncbi:hypothetical protein MKW94_013760 [Papaver nudicaule]|uniref:J domain-containing protein n=1 Tax=Papaver nudicaule TaxID=74823 RepID=A0AA41VX20_PAPNU|nr:hypothetical protein [Papaver nudicaule]